MGEGKSKLLELLRPAVLTKSGLASARVPAHLKGTVYTWTDDGDRLEWGPNAQTVLGLDPMPLPPTGKAFSALVEPGMGLGRSDAIAADAVVSHPRGIPYYLRYALRLGASNIVRVEDRGRWFADRHGRPVMAHGMLSLLDKIDPSLLSTQTAARSAFLTAISQHGGPRGLLRNVSLIAFAVTFPPEKNKAGENFAGVHDHPNAQDILEAITFRARGLMRHHDRMMVKPDGSVVLAFIGRGADEVAEAASYLRTRLASTPVQLPDGPVTIALRIGAASAPDHAGSALHLLCHAEEALRCCGPNDAFTIFDGWDHTPASFEKALKTFLDDAELLSESALGSHLALARRPLVDTATRLAPLHLAGPGRRDSDGKIVPAEDLLFAAASSPNHAIRLDRHLLALSCAELGSNHDSFTLLPISAASLTSNEWPVILADKLGAHPDIASRLIIGVSETVVAANPALAERRMAAMKALGIGIAIVDFGGGFLPNSHLDSLPVDLVSLDGALVQNVAASADNRFHLRSAVNFMQSRDIAVAAPWVEDESTAALLGDWGVNYVEGRVRTATPAEMPLRRIA